MASDNVASVRLARRIYERIRLTGTFRLRSGVLSDEYFDKYLFESDPVLLREVARALLEVMPEERVDALAGLELGGVPLATVASQISGLPTLFVRKKPKDYGTCRLAEGGEVSGRRIVVIEDVVSSGGQIIDSCLALREQGADVNAVLCVIDRRDRDAPDRLAEAGLELRPLFTIDALRKAAARTVDVANPF